MTRLLISGPPGSGDQALWTLLLRDQPDRRRDGAGDDAVDPERRAGSMTPKWIISARSGK